jgi:hypothetical protein
LLKFTKIVDNSISADLKRTDLNRNVMDIGYLHSFLLDSFRTEFLLFREVIFSSIEEIKLTILYIISLLGMLRNLFG